MNHSEPLPLPLPQRVSLVSQTVASLKQGIRSGHWQGQLPGERELGEELQVSRRTLRAALRELETGGWLEVQARQTRRICSGAGEQRAEPVKKVVAVLMPGSFLSLPSRIAYIVESVRSKLAAAGYEVQFHVQPACYGAQPDRALAAFVAQHPAVVWLLLHSQRSMQAWFSRHGHTALVFGSPASGIALPSVDVDFYAACHHAAGVFWRKGHRHLALVLRQGGFGGDVASEEGMRAGLKALPGSQLQVLLHDGSAADLGAKLDAMMAAAQRPSACLVAGSAHALTVMMHLMRRGLRLPEDVAVICRDHDPMLEAASPQAARYMLDPAKVVGSVVKALRQLAETGTGTATVIRLMPDFVPGDSI